MTNDRISVTALTTRGLRRFLGDAGFESVVEFTPTRGLRTDIFAISRSGEIWIVEVKSSLEDFRADQKWRGYEPWCDCFYFGVGPGFPLEALPAEIGVLRADSYDAAILRPAEPKPLAAARRKALTLRFARDAAARLRRFEDPPATSGLVGGVGGDGSGEQDL